MGKLLTFFTMLLCAHATFYGQCADEQTFTVCDMTVVDGDGDGTFDGIVNLYDEFNAITGSTLTPADGVWFDPDFNFALNDTNGDLFVWDLDNSSENETDYQFQFLNTSSGCPDDIQFLLNVVVGPFAGNPSPPFGTNSANVTVCEAGLSEFDLFQVFEPTPAPHENGVWAFVGNDGDPDNFGTLTQDGMFTASIPYTPMDGSLVDSDVFEFTYTVPGIAPCATEMMTNFRVEVVRDVQAGNAGSEFLCQSEMFAGGPWDRDIILADEYLEGEDIEGTWSSMDDPSGQISGPGDGTINLYEAYLDHVTNNGPAISCLSFGYTYTVEPRINLANCDEKLATIVFTIAEEIRPFSQDTPFEICEDAETPVSIDLYDQLTFTTEVWNNPNTGSDEDILFDYPSENCTSWELVSGPDTLGILSNTGMAPGSSTIDWCSAFVLGVGYTTPYRTTGTINFSDAEPGTYVFRYTVLPSYHCQEIDTCNTDASCTHPCDIQTADVTVIIQPKNYAGEDTADLEFCETESPLVLTDLLEVNDEDGPVYVGPDGTWTDLADGSTIDNNYDIPEITTGSQVFNFEYNTTTADGCLDSATLSFTAYQQYDPGENGPLIVCNDDGEVDLFTLLGGTPDTNGTWTGPEGFTTTDNIALFDPETGVEGEYVYTVPANVTCPEASATVTVTIEDALYAGEDTEDVEVCEDLVTIDLFTLLETNDTDTIDTTGEWTDASGTTIVNPFTIPAITDSQLFEFTYTTSASNGCEDMATLSFTIFQQFSAGEDNTESICDDSSSINLFDLLGGTPDTNGTWSGPNGYSTSDSDAPFDPTNDAPGDYTYTVPANGACESDTATILITLLEGDYAGENTTDVEVCDNLGTLDLTSLLDTNGTDTVVTGGEWTDGSGTVIEDPFTIPTIDGSQTFDFTYTTTSDDGCINSATLSFTIFEESNPGTGGLYETCEDGAAINLFDELSGTPDTDGTWSGPNGYSTTDNNAPFTPMTDVEGDYIYTTPANGACAEATATITVSFFVTDYAGEDTLDAEACDISGTIDLTTFLDTNGTDTVAGTGVWTDLDTGTTVANPFTIPTIDGSQTFNFMYNTSTANGCLDESLLSITIFESGDAGIGALFETCVDQPVFNLFDLLSGSPDTDGTWSGPNGYTASGTGATINPATDVTGEYTYTVPANGACDAVSSTINVSLSSLSNAGGDVDTIICPGDYTQSLFSLLETNANMNGIFTDLATGDEVPNGLVEVGVLGAGSFSYDYTVSNGSCGPDSATIDFTITPVSTPTIILEQYCVNDGVTLGDLDVSGADDFAWYAFAEAGDPLSLSTLLLDGQVFYLAAIDDNGCESERVQYVANILPLNDGLCGSGISTGVSDNDDGMNDFLDLGSLPTVFPDFDIQIFNRYGTIVYRGDSNTPFFTGSSNTGSGLGDQLPTGVYFYIFYPNTEDAEPIDGNFYLSR